MKTLNLTCTIICFACAIFNFALGKIALGAFCLLASALNYMCYRDRE